LQGGIEKSVPKIKPPKQLGIPITKNSKKCWLCLAKYKNIMPVETGKN